MNPAERRKQIGQVVVLIILLCILGGSMFFMLRAVGVIGRKPRTPPSQPATAAAVERAEPAAPTEAGEEPAEEGAAPVQAEMAAPPAGINPNLFRIYRLDPPKNPFVQQEQWYEEQLAQYPGYPILRDDEYFESMAPYVPEIEGLLQEGDEWTQVKLERLEEPKQWSIEGHSQDELIATRLTLTGPPPEVTTLEWNRSTGVPLTALSEPGWGEDIASRMAAPVDLQDGEDLFQPPPGLQIPGLTGSVDGLLTDGLAGGDQVFCHGISGEGVRATALVSHNGVPMLVGAGDTLPPRYQIEAVTGDGVVLLELRSGETKWLPVTEPMAPDSEGANPGRAS